MVGVRGRVTDRVNRGRLGPKGLHGWRVNQSKDRLKYPMIRKNGKLERASWDEAMSLIVRKAEETRSRLTAHGIGFYTSGQLFLEEYYALAIVGKAGLCTLHMCVLLSSYFDCDCMLIIEQGRYVSQSLGQISAPYQRHSPIHSFALACSARYDGSRNTNNLRKGNTRLCTASAAASMRESFGSDGQPGSYTDIDYTSCIMLVGHNMASTQTVLWSRILDRLEGPNPPSESREPRGTTL